MNEQPTTQSTPMDVNQVIRKMEMQQANLQLEVCFQKNMSFFEKKNAQICQRYKDYHPTELGLLYTDEGYINLVNINLENKPVYDTDPCKFSQSYVNRYAEIPLFYKIDASYKEVLGGEDDAHISKINPLVKTILENEQVVMGRGIMPDTNFMLMLGIGLGYQIEQLLAHTDIHHLVIIEPHEDIFYAALHTVDWENIYTHFDQPNHSLQYIVGQTDADCFNVLRTHISRIGIHNVIKPFVFNHLTSDEINQSTKLFFERLPAIVTTMGYFDDERISLSHTVANYRNGIPPLREHVLINKQYLDTPAFVIANGPSLDKAVEFLKSNHQKVIIFSCGTALGSLYKMGIKPDFHIEMERTRPIIEWIESGTDPEFREGIVLLALNPVHPDAFKLFSQSGMGMKSNDLGSHFISQYISKDHYVINVNQCNPTVVNSGMAFSSAMGFKEIYLFGADLGFSEGEQHHSSLSTHYDIKEEHVEGLGLYKTNRAGNLQLPGNFGGKVLSTVVYNTAKQSIQTLLSVNEGISCFNTSEGISIEGAKPTRYEDIRLGDAIVDRNKLVKDLFSKNFHTRGLKKIGSKQNVFKSFEHTVKLCDIFIQLFEHDATSVNDAFELLDKHHQIAIEAGINKTTQYSYSLVKGSINSFNLALAKCLYNCESEEKSVALFNRCKVYYQEFLELAKQKIALDLLAQDRRSRDLHSKFKENKT